MQTMAQPNFTLAHVGINAGSEAEALSIAELFGAIFGFEVKAGNSSVFAGKGVEVMKAPYLGAHGHIAFATPDMEGAVAYLQSKGYELASETAKYRDGALSAVYLKQDFNGFAVHIVCQA